jgi:hypothetical protein
MMGVFGLECFPGVVVAEVLILVVDVVTDDVVAERDCTAPWLALDGDFLGGETDALFLETFFVSINLLSLAALEVAFFLVPTGAPFFTVALSEVRFGEGDGLRVLFRFSVRLFCLLFCSCLCGTWFVLSAMAV